MLPMNKKQGAQCANTSSPKFNRDHHHRRDNNNNTNNTQNPKSGDEAPNNPTPTTNPSMLALAIGSWLRSRRSRLVVLLLCSPILLPLLFASLPFLCAIEACIRICRRRRRKSAEEDSPRRCEEGCCGCGRGDDEREVGLLQRYLEDQLMLVGSVYDCADDDQLQCPDQIDCTVPLLS